MIVEHTLLAYFFAIDAHIVTTRKVLHHTLLFRVIYVYFSVVAEEITFCLCRHRATGTFKVAGFAVGILHMLQVVAARPKTFVALNAHEALFFVFINVVHAHGCRFLIVTMIAALRAVNVVGDLLITFVLLDEAWSQVS